MIVTNTATPFDNQVVCGEKLIPADTDSAHAVFVRHGRACGVTYECGTLKPYLRFNPQYQLPSWARNKKSFNRFLWECEDDRAINIRLDERDGELVYICREDNVDDNIEYLIEDNLEFLLGDAFYNGLIEFVGSFND